MPGWEQCLQLFFNKIRGQKSTSEENCTVLPFDLADREQGLLCFPLFIAQLSGGTTKIAFLIPILFDPYKLLR